MVHHTLKGNPHISDAEYMAKLKANCRVNESGCWEWQRFIFPTTGYGAASYRGKQIKAHRLSYMLFKGPIPDGLYVLHSCDVRHCINPDHLRLGTISDNKQDELQRGRNYEANRTHCPQGHAYAEHGVVYRGSPWRKCKLCQRAKERRRAGWPEDRLYDPPIPMGARTERRTFRGGQYSSGRR